jgi:CheY-like chemotaxis protein
VRQAEDGRQAVEMLRREAFDALIVDVYLPVIDGARVIQTARGELGLADLPIIAVSAGGDSARKSALDAGANIFLDKPMRLRQVIDTIQKLLT